MLSRRGFIKALASMLLAAAGGAALWQLLQRREASALDAATPQPAAQGAAPSDPSEGEPLLSLFLLSDIHMTTGNAGMKEKLHLALQDITRSELPLDALVLGGDLVDGGREGDYQLLQEILAGYRLPPAYGLMGNHEYYHIWYDASGAWNTGESPNGKTDAEARERFIRFMGYPDHPYHDVWVNGVHLIMLSQEAYVQERPEVGEGPGTPTSSWPGSGRGCRCMPTGRRPWSSSTSRCPPQVPTAPHIG